MQPIEIEFLCVNSLCQSNYKEILQKHIFLMNKLVARKNIYPYRQDFSVGKWKQFSFAVIVTTYIAKRFVLKEAEKIGLPVDTFGYISEGRIADVIDGKMEGQL